MTDLRILIDGDACNVITKVETVAAKHDIETHIYCDTSRVITSEVSIVHIVDTAPDSTDFAIIRQCRKHDIIITADTGLASMAMSLGAIVLNPKGFKYTQQNINSYLTSRHLRQRAVRQTGRKQVATSPIQTKRTNFTKLLTTTIDRIKKET